MAATELTWSGSLHQTFRLLPHDKQSGNLRPFLEADGLAPTDLLEKLPYDRARAKDQTKDAPDAKRYRDYQPLPPGVAASDCAHKADNGMYCLRPRGHQGEHARIASVWGDDGVSRINTSTG